MILNAAATHLAGFRAMAFNSIRALAIFDDDKAPLAERIDAARSLALWASNKAPEVPGVEELFQRVLVLWQSLCTTRDELDLHLLHDRARAAEVGTLMSKGLPGGQRMFRNVPRLNDVEGPDRFRSDVVVRGKFNFYMASIYEFHLEHPIEGHGVYKNLISVVEVDGSRTALFDWCRRHDVIVWCSRCGLEITYEVSRDCPFRRRKSRRRPKHSRPTLVPDPEE